MANIWQKAFSRIFWRNRDKGAPYTPLGESKLLPMDASIDEMDDRILVLNTTKAEQSDLLTAFKSVSFNSATGVFTFTKFNDTTVTVDTDIEKIAINFDYDDDPTSAHYQNLIITLKDGTIKYVDMSALLTQYEFTDSTTIHFTVTNGIVSANVINGSITSDHLSPELNAKINNAEYYSEESEAWAVGQKNGQDVPSTDPRYHNNSKYYAEQAEASLSNTVRSFNGRNGAVAPTDGDYNIEQISPLNGAAVGQVPVIQNVGTAQEPVYKFGMQFVSGGGIGTCNSIEPFSLAFLVTVNAGFNVAIGSYLSVIFANNFYYSGGNPLRLSVNNQLYEVRINGEVPVAGKTYIKTGDAGIFVYDGTYFQLIGTSGGGHSIIDSDGNTMPQETAMQFADSHVSDDSTNGRTVVENVKEVTLAELSQATERGMYLATDEESVPIGEIEEDYEEVIADGDTTYEDLFILLHSKIDASKVTKEAKLVRGTDDLFIFHMGINYLNKTAPNNYADFFSLDATGGRTQDCDIIRIGSSPAYYTLNGGTGAGTNHLTQKPSDGSVWRFYYGTSSSIVELNTDARHCMMSNGQSVEWGMGEKTTLCTIMSAETVFNMTQASVNYAVQHSGFYSITVVNANNVTHDSDVNIGGVAIASQYLTYHYQRYTALIPLKAGTQITINGAVGDGVIINYGWGNM